MTTEHSAKPAEDTRVPVPPPAAGTTAPAAHTPPLAQQIKLQVARVLHAWAKEHAKVCEQFQKIAGWLELGTTDLSADTLDEMLQSYQKFRRVLWINYVVNRKQPWENIITANLGRAIMTIDDIALHGGGGGLRCPHPFNPEVLLDHLKKMTDQPKDSERPETVAALFLRGS